MSKWNEETVATLQSIVGKESPVTVGTMTKAALELDFTLASVASKLRKLGHEVESYARTRTKTFSDEETSKLKSFLLANPGKYTYGELAEAFAGGKFSPRQLQGLVFQYDDLRTCIRPTPKKEVELAYTEEQTAKFVEMATAGAHVEDIAEALGKSMNSVRGKALSLLKSGTLSKIPSQKQSYAADKNVDPVEALGDISDLTVDEIATKVGKTPRGVRSLLTHRGLDCLDWSGSTRKEKAEAKRVNAA